MAKASTDLSRLLDRNELTESERRSLLASEQRRKVIAVLADRHAPIALEDLAVAVAVRSAPDADGSDGDLATDRTALDLHHSALPYMDDAGIIEYDTDVNRVESVAVDEISAPPA